MSKQIQLSQGKYTIVDDEDYEYLNQWKWCISADGYAIRTTQHKNEKGRYTSIAIRIHRVVMNAPVGLHVDHINRDKTDNRKCNLRICTNAENLRNATLHSKNKSGYRGVCWHRITGKWVTQITVDSKKKFIGYFVCPIEAAKAYNKAAIQYFGEFANLNQIPE